MQNPRASWKVQKENWFKTEGSNRGKKYPGGPEQGCPLRVTTTTNECFAIYTPTRQIVALVNIAQADQVSSKRVVFQIAYDEHRLTTRTDLLRQNGYEVVSVVGNEAAKILLSSPQHCDLFIVGHAAPEQTRKEMVDWLKARYPRIKILALNSPDHRQIAGVDHNVILNGPNEWLSIVTDTLS